jgi:hypothetical protein
VPYTFPVADVNSQAIEAILDDILFYIVLDWNDSGQYWTMAIRNSAYSTLVDGISISANYPLTWQFRYRDMPPGELWVISARYRNGPVPRDGFSSGLYQLTYQTVQDLIDSNTWDQYRQVALAI